MDSIECAISEKTRIVGDLLIDSYFGGLLRADRTNSKRITTSDDGFLVTLATISSDELSTLVSSNAISSWALSCKLRCLALNLAPVNLKIIYEFLLIVTDELDYLDNDLPIDSIEAYLTYTHKDAPIHAKLLTTLARRDPTFLLAAIKHKRTKVAVFLIDSGFGLENGEVALKSACINRLEAVALKLIDANGGLENNSTALLACGYKMETLALKLISTGIDLVNETGDTALMWACVNQMDLVVSRLIDTGRCFINNADHCGDTALILACRIRATSIALELIATGCDLDHVNKKGNSALLEACANRADTIALRLINAGCAVNHVNSTTGDTALILACANEMKDVALKLISKGCSLNHMNNKGFTALSLTCSKHMMTVAATVFNDLSSF